MCVVLGGQSLVFDDEGQEQRGGLESCSSDDIPELAQATGGLSVTRSVATVRSVWDKLPVRFR